MTQVAGLQAVGAEGQVIGTLSVDDLTELVATKIVQEAKNEAISARSASVMSEASTIAATASPSDARGTFKTDLRPDASRRGAKRRGRKAAPP